jgi:hypothetical protein
LAVSTKPAEHYWLIAVKKKINFTRDHTQFTQFAAVSPLSGVGKRKVP